MRGDTVQIRLVGVNVDNRADGKGKAGLTFMTTTYVSEIDTNMADTNTNIGGYRDVRNRKDSNEGQYRYTINTDVYQYLTPVLKTQDNQANGEMNNDKHSATSNAIVEKVGMPSPLELNMSVGGSTGNRNDNPTPTGLIQYNGGKWRWAYYNYLYSGNAPYEYYKNNISNISEYCRLTRGNGLFVYSRPSCQGIPRIGKRLWFRAPYSGFNNSFSVFDSAQGSLGYYSSSYSFYRRIIALLSF